MLGEWRRARSDAPYPFTNILNAIRYAGSLTSLSHRQQFRPLVALEHYWIEIPDHVHENRNCCQQRVGNYSYVQSHRKDGYKNRCVNKFRSPGLVIVLSQTLPCPVEDQSVVEQSLAEPCVPDRSPKERPEQLDSQKLADERE
jgi:hypothetical protein